MVRLQATIDDKVFKILEQLLRRNDRARFIELAIKHARENPEIVKQFAWENEEITIKPSTKSKISFDDEFE